MADPVPEAGETSMSQEKNTENTVCFGSLERVLETPVQFEYEAEIKIKDVNKPVENSDWQNHEDFKEESGVLFYTNRGGFPIGDFTWDRMWNHVTRIHPGGQDVINKARYTQKLPEVSIPQAPQMFPFSTPVPDRVDTIQKYMSSLQYNHTGTQFYEIKKYRPLSGLMDLAKDMIKESLPIKCLEAVILGIYLTNGTQGLERFTIGFKSVFNGNTHRHVVLGLYHAGRWGALGMSRREDLMYKPIVFKSLAQLILDYKSAYEKYWHKLKKVKVGMLVPHDSHSCEPVPWKGLVLESSDIKEECIVKMLDKHAKDIKSKVRGSSLVDPNAMKSLLSKAGPNKTAKSKSTSPKSPKKKIDKKTPMKENQKTEKIETRKDSPIPAEGAIKDANEETTDQKTADNTDSTKPEQYQIRI